MVMRKRGLGLCLPSPKILPRSDAEEGVLAGLSGITVVGVVDVVSV